MAIKNFKVGDVLSETSHYIVEALHGGYISVKHQESGDSDINIYDTYVNKYLNSADEVLKEVKVGKEDKYWTQKQIDEVINKNCILKTPEAGDLRVQGIRSIFEDIHSPQVFTVCFKKQDKPKSAKALKIETEERANKFAEAIDKVKSQKKGVAEAAKLFIEELVKHPILPYEEGEERVLRGYKIQFESRDGKYNCVDMDIQEENNIRPVNINTILYLIYNGVKYTVE